MSRSPDEIAYELDTLDTAHLHNETNRDTFIALAHTALLAASVSFIGDVAPLHSAAWKPLVIVAWAASVVGLLAHTFSFVVIRKEIDARRSAINEEAPPESKTGENLNNLALWTFPIALLLIFAFVSANVMRSDGRPAQTSVLDKEGSDSSTTRSEPGRPSDAMDRRNPSAESADTTSSPSQTAKKVTRRQ